MSLGPVVGGLLVDSIGWRGTFYVNIPVGLAAIALTARFVPESRAPRARRPDPAGQGLIIVMLGSLTYAIIEGPARGWRAPVILALFAVAVAAFGAFVAYEARRPEPVLDPRFFRSAPLSGAVLTAISATAAVGGFLFLATLYLQDVRGMSAVRAGLHLLPMATMVALGALVSSRILARRGARLPMVAAGVALAAGGVLLSRLTASSGLVPLAVAFVVFGIGGGVINAPITYTAVSGLPVSQAGVASGIASTSRQIGQVLGIAVAGSILAGNLRGEPLRAGFVTASHADWLLLAVMGAVIVVLGLVTASRWALGTAARYAGRPAIFRRSPRPVIVMSRWPVLMMPRRRQLLRARVTVARDAPARLASSSCDSGTAMCTSSPVSLPYLVARSSRTMASRWAPLVTGWLRSLESASFHSPVTTWR
jgi:MFS family permease